MKKILHSLIYLTILLSAFTGFSQDCTSASTIRAADIDGDGDMDVLSTSVNDSMIIWHENLGYMRFKSHAISASGQLCPQQTHLVDLDNDGDLDVVSAFSDRLAWYENLGRGNFGNPETNRKEIKTGTNNIASVYAADLDNDGHTDIISAFNTENKIVWYKKKWMDFFGIRFLIWEEQTITTEANGVSSVYATDLDNDNDIDILSTLPDDNTLSWYENDGNGNFSGHHIINGQVDGASSIYATDIDGDGDLDVLAASAGDDAVNWFENKTRRTLLGQREYSWTKHQITTGADKALSVHAADMDGDGDMDVLSASYNDDKIAWYENDGRGNFGEQKNISTNTDGAVSVYAADLDGDKDIDVLSAATRSTRYQDYPGDDGKLIAWHINNKISKPDLKVLSGKVEKTGPLLISSGFPLKDKLSVQTANTGRSSALEYQVGAIVKYSDGTQWQFSEDVDLPPDGQQPGESHTHTFKTIPADFSSIESNDYEVTFYVSHPEDDNHQYDTIPPVSLSFNDINIYNGKLPFRGRVKATPEATFNGKIANVPGMQSATFLTGSENGSIHLYDYAYDIQDRSTLMMARSEGGTADLLFTLDLSAYDAQKDRLKLEVNLNARFADNSPNNKIFIRGNADLPWLTLYDWGSATGNSNLQRLKITTISRILREGGQQYGKTFQLRFGLEQSGSNISSLLLGNVLIDYMPDVAIISGIVPEISPFLGESESLSVEIENKGRHPVSNIPLFAQINYVNGPPKEGEAIPVFPEIQDTISVELAPGQRVVHEFKEKVNFNRPGNYELSFYTTLFDDVNPEDDLVGPISCGKIDVYTEGLPFREDFEQAVDNIDISGKNIAVIPGLQAATFLTNGSGGQLELTGSPGSEFETRQIRMRTNDPEESTNLVFTMDLSAYDVNGDQLELELRAHAGSLEDRIDIRGNADLSWLSLYSWGDNESTDTIENLKFTNISQVLKEGGQQYGGTFQLRFHHRGPGSLRLDDIVIRDLISNTAPELADSIPDQQLTRGFNIHTIDISSVFADKEEHQLELNAIASNENIVSLSIENDILSLTERGAGLTTITITASDGHGGTVSDTFKVEVMANRAPVVVRPIQDRQLISGFGVYRIDLTEVFSDEDGHRLTLTSVSDDPKVILSDIERNTLILTEQGRGNTTITVTADDGYEGSTNHVFNVQVAENNPPVVENRIEDRLMRSGFGTLRINLEGIFSDADGHDLNLTAASADPEIVSVSLSGNELVLTEMGTGDTDITISADDGHGGTANIEFNVRVLANAFVSTWRITEAGQQIRLPLVSSGVYDFTVDWGDGSSGRLTDFQQTDQKTHTYSEAGTYTISISGEINGWSFGFPDGESRSEIIEINSWGPLRLGSRTSMHFNGCNNLRITAPDLLNTSEVTSFRKSFQACSSLTIVPRMEEWDMSSVTDMNGMFGDATNFNQNIRNWDVSNVRSMRSMFHQALNFNGNIENWNVSNVTDMAYMFNRASAFNRDIGNWNVSSVDNMKSMFSEASVFDQNIGNWNVSRVTDMRAMFYNAFAFNRDIGNWDVSNVMDMRSMFEGVTLSTPNYEALIRGWEAQNVQNNIIFNGGSSRYTAGGDAETARTRLINDHNWTISDGGALSVTATVGMTNNEGLTIRNTETIESGDIEREVIFYPNPAEEILTLRSPRFSGTKIDFQLFDITGRISTLFPFKINENTYRLDLSGRQSGIYFLGIHIPDIPVILKKIVIK
ncbi:BspA family leucine-rich repeat surface protein [Leptobacterium flavescens]|uniref:BspA family leucine-rich repeat surface protein n=1 Tax=Leptobacterium flavescens TaxID=472055 RepID=A0A6P0UF20_9FLAO|nr:BspA family leucine-rich repeat surface protein [Leptobacterium flavescens]NER11864.1 BspA family leucine-rich repeat surface protein [Leptobacterium flavescens]